MGIFPQIITHFGEQGGVFGKTLHQDIARTVEGGFGIGHAFFRVDKFRGFRFRIV
ncbi:hypothetical protein D3C76_1326150 [compost metagenome]